MRLVYLSPVPWASFAQRPHKFVEWFHFRTHSDVLWIDPYPTRLPEIPDCRRRSRGEGKTEIPAWLKLLTPRAMPLEPLPGSGLINGWLWQGLLAKVADFIAQGECLIGIGKPSKLALQVLQRFPGCDSLYDAMDDFPAFYAGLSRMSMRRREKLLLDNVDTVLTSSTALFARLKSRHQTVLMALNACDLSSLPLASECIATDNSPIIGYVGTIAAWFDWPLVVSLANAVQDVSIRLIGPLYSSPPPNLPSNVQLLPACSHSAAMNAMRQFGVGLIPFRGNELTASVDPIKYYEYRALGLPVLSTPFGEMGHRRSERGVYILDETTDLAQAVALAFAGKSTREQIDRFREGNSWQSRFDASGLLQLIGSR